MCVKIEEALTQSFEIAEKNSVVEPSIQQTFSKWLLHGRHFIRHLGRKKPMVSILAISDTGGRDTQACKYVIIAIANISEHPQNARPHAKSSLPRTASFTPHTPMK